MLLSCSSYVNWFLAFIRLDSRLTMFLLCCRVPMRAHTSIGFFIGILLDIYGVLILGASIADLSNPAEHPVVLANLHAGIWWGALLIILGLIYTFAFAPNRRRA